MVLSDFCLQPTEFTLDLLSVGSVKAAAQYYLTCTGTSPTYSYIYESDYAVRNLNYYIETLLNGECIDNFALSKAGGYMSAISSDHIPVVEDLASCVEYYDEWTTFVETGMCNDIFGGLYIIWISQSVTVILLLICIIVGIRLIPLLNKVSHDQMELLGETQHNSSHPEPKKEKSQNKSSNDVSEVEMRWIEGTSPHDSASANNY
jgi:hypothetical protein